MSVELDKNLPDTIRMSPRQYALTYAQTLRDFARAYYGCHWKARVSRRTGLNTDTLRVLSQRPASPRTLHLLTALLVPLGFKQPYVRFPSYRLKLEGKPRPRRAPRSTPMAQLVQSVYTHSSPVTLDSPRS